MPDTASQPDFWRRLARTPMRDWVRGRVTGRMDVKWVIDRSDVPQQAKTLIHDLVRRTRLWKLEKVDVATELIAHFADGLDAGKSIDTILAAFGDIRATARLIRRAKKRNRSLAWKLFIRSSQALACFVVLYILAAILLFLDHPTPTVDYLTQINAAALAVPESDQGWPIYRDALIKADFANVKVFDIMSGSMRIREVTPADPQWSDVLAYVQDHADLLAAIRAGAAKPGLGLTVSQGIANWSPEDRLALFRPQETPVQPYVPQNHIDELLSGSLISVLLPHLAPMRRMGRLLAADITLAAEQGDSQRILDDAAAMLGLSRQAREQPILINELVGLAITSMIVDCIGRVLHEKPDLFTDSQLQQLAHMLAALNDWHTPDFTGESWMIEDTLQRIYGRSGRVTMEGLAVLNAMTSSEDEIHYPVFKQPLMAAGTPVLAAWIAPRDQMLAQYRRLMNMTNEDARQPLRDLYLKQSYAVQQLIEWKTSQAGSVRYLPLAILMPALDRATRLVRLGYFARLALQIAIAAELYKRDHNKSYPSSIDQLVPQYLPEIPIDESATSGNLILKVSPSPQESSSDRQSEFGNRKFIIIYGRGLDDDDDGGAATPNYQRHWPELDSLTQPDGSIGSDGDWILYPPPEP